MSKVHKLISIYTIFFSRPYVPNGVHRLDDDDISLFERESRRVKGNGFVHFEELWLCSLDGGLDGSDDIGYSMSCNPV